MARFQRLIRPRTGNIQTQPRRSITTISKEKIAISNNKSIIDNSINSFINSVSNLKNIDSELNNYYTYNINNIPRELKQYFLNTLNSKKINLIAKQKNQILSLNSNIERYKALENKYDAISDKIKKDGYDASSELAEEEKYKVLQKETQNIINRLKNGEILETSRINNYLNQIGQQQYDQTKAYQSQRYSGRQQAQKQTTALKLAEESLKTGKTLTPQEIKVKSGLSLIESQRLSKQLTKLKETTIPKIDTPIYYVEDPNTKQTRLASFSEIIDQRPTYGFSYDPNSLFVSQQEANKLLDNYIKKNEIKLTERPKLFSFEGSIAQKLVYSSIIKDIKNKIEKQGGLTRNEYNEYTKRLQDLTGLKTLSKKVVSSLKQRQKQGLLGILTLGIDLLKYVKDQTIDIAKVLKRDGIALWELTKQGGKLALESKKALGNLILNTGKILLLNPEQKLKALKSIEKDFSNYDESVKITQEILKNPEIILLGGAILVANGTKNIANTIVNNPKRAISEIASLFLTPELIKSGIKGSKLITKKIKTVKFKNKVTKSLLKNIDNTIIPVDWNVEAIDFLNKNPSSKKLIITKDGIITLDFGKPSIKASKQLTLLKEKDIVKKLDIPILKNNYRTKIITKDFSIEILKKPKELKQTKLSDFGIVNKKLNVNTIKFQKASREIIFIDKNGDYIKITKRIKPTKQAKLIDDVGRLFNNKKGQARLRLITKTEQKVFTKYLNNVGEGIKKNISLATKTKIINKTALLSKLRKALIIVLKLKRFISSLKLKAKLTAKAKATKKLVGTLKKTAKAKATKKLRLTAKAKKVLKLKKISVAKLKPLTKQEVKALSKIKIITPKKIKFLKIPKIKIRFNKNDTPKGFKPLVKIRYTKKGNIITSNKTYVLNKGLKRIIQLVDNSLARSMDLIIVGYTKEKDIKKPSLNKFRLKLSKDSKVLRLVEKSRYAIDTYGEKKGLTIAKVLKEKRVINNVKRKIYSKSKNKIGKNKG